MQAQNLTQTASPVISKKGEILSAAILGAMIFLFVGFSPMQVLHNAAHDTRHANVFPCH